MINRSQLIIVLERAEDAVYELGYKGLARNLSELQGRLHDGEDVTSIKRIRTKAREPRPEKRGTLTERIRKMGGPDDGK